MGQQQLVTIEGTHMATVKLPRGARVTVVDTPQVRRRVALGQVKIVATYPAEQTGERPDDADPGTAVAPAKNASRDDWAAFLHTLTPPVEFDAADPDVGRNDLIALYDEWVKANPPQD